MQICRWFRGLAEMKPSKLQKLLALSGSANEHEATNAAVMLAKGLRKANVDLEKALTRRREPQWQKPYEQYRSDYRRSAAEERARAAREKAQRKQAREKTVEEHMADIRRKAAAQWAAEAARAAADQEKRWGKEWF